MPTAAAVPIAVEMSAALTASTSVFFTDSSVSESRNSSSYQWNEKPEKTDRLLASLKEKTRRIRIGAKRKSMMSPV